MKSLAMTGHFDTNENILCSYVSDKNKCFIKKISKSSSN